MFWLSLGYWIFKNWLLSNLLNKILVFSTELCSVKFSWITQFWNRVLDAVLINLNEHYLFCEHPNPLNNLYLEMPAKELQEATRDCTIHLSKRYQLKKGKHLAPRTIRDIKKFVEREMRTKVIWADTSWVIVVKPSKLLAMNYPLMEWLCWIIVFIRLCLL